MVKSALMLRSLLAVRLHINIEGDLCRFADSVNICESSRRVCTSDGPVSAPVPAEYMLPGPDAFTLLLCDHQRAAVGKRFSLSSVFSSRTSSFVSFRVIGPPQGHKANY